MSWADDYYAGTYMVKTSGIGTADQIYYTKKFLPALMKKVRFAGLGDPRPLPMYSGRTTEMYRYNEIEATPAGTLLTAGVNPNATQFTTQKLQATIAEYGQFVQIESLLADTYIDPQVEGVIPRLTNAGARVIDIRALSVCASSWYPMRADLDTTKEFEDELDSVVSTTQVQCTALQANTNYGDADHDLNQSILIMLDGSAAGQGRAVTAYDAVDGGHGNGNGLITVAPAFDTSPTAGDRFRVCSYDALTSGDDLSYENIKRAVAMLSWYGAMGENDYFVGVVDPFSKEKLMDDTKWIDVGLYQDGTALFKGEIGKRWGVRWVESNNPYRFPITTIGTNSTSYGPGEDGENYSALEDVTMVPIMGQKAFSITRMVNEAGAVDKAMVQVKTPGKNSTDQPINRFKTAAWYARLAVKATQGLWGVMLGVNNAQ